MSWKKYFKPVNSVMPSQSGISTNSSAVSKFSSWLPEYYQGPPNRIMRYLQYDQMDMDHEVAAALDTIADFSTHISEHTNLPFEFNFHSEASPSEAAVLEKTLRQWCNINEFDRRLFRLFRSTLKYGDQFFIRDPETYKLYWVDPSTVERVLVNESTGKTIEAYYVKDLDLNLKDLTASNVNRRTADGYNSADAVFPSVPYSGQVGGGGYGTQSALGGTGYNQVESFPVDAAHMVHISLTEGMTPSWPFGISILENIFKVYKQKELLEDSVLIYRIHRAPERRIFYIDTGTLPPNKAAQYLERVKYEVQQKRIPSRTGGGDNITDAAYNPMCLDLSTKIPLLDGRVLSLEEIIKERNSGKENWVYSCDPITGAVMPGNITWAGVTKENAEVIKITLDNDEEIICTPDHKIPVLGRGFVEAQDLTEDDPLISFETRMKSLSKDPKRSYQQVYDHESNKWVFTHRMVAEFFQQKDQHETMIFNEEYADAEKTVVHHVDFDRYNNNPENLMWMNHQDHIEYHSATKKQYWESLSPEESERVKNKIRKGLEKYRRQNPEEFQARYDNRDTSWIQKMHVNEPEKYAQWRKNLKESKQRFYENNPEKFEEMRSRASESLKKNKAQNQELNFTQDMLTRLVEIVKENDSNRLETIELANKDRKMMKLLRESNPIDPKSTHNINNTEFTASKLNKMYRIYGFDGWKDFKEKTTVYNHRVKSIQKLSNRNVGTITVDFEEQWHDHHTFALESGIFVKNSSLEDYYFAVTADGRGSKVDTLPAGENLGQIDDLRYFNNKMLRGLGVPSGYLPTGPEDGSNAYNDGRVGAAFIQEFRFSRVCERYQRLIQPVLDREFKLFLKQRGVNIDSGMFDIVFTAPQNFSEYRQLELDQARASLFNNVSGVEHLSKRFALKKYLGLSDAEVLENERLWREENDVKHHTQDQSPSADLRSADIRTGGLDMDFGGDFGGDLDLDTDTGEAGGEAGDTGDIDTDLGDETQL